MLQFEVNQFLQFIFFLKLVILAVKWNLLNCKTEMETGVSKNVY